MAQWKIDELTRRKEAFLKDPSTARSWEQVKARVLGQHARNQEFTDAPPLKLHPMVYISCPQETW